MPEPLPNYIVQNGKLIGYEEAVTHVMSPAVKYGLAAFEGLCAYWSDSDQELFAFRLQEHTERLFQSMKLLRFEPTFSADEINDRTIELLRRNNVREPVHIRAIAYLDGKGEHIVPGPVGYAISALPLARSSKTQTGIRCQVSAWTRISDGSMPPRIKTSGNYVNSRLARLQARHDGYDDAILLNNAGTVAESPGACIFLRRRDELITPDVTSGILESITRDTILHLAREAGIQVTERPVDKTELYTAREIFLVGSAAEVLPVVDVDGISIGDGSPGPMTAELQRGYFDAVIGQTALEQGWLTRVHQT
ncbi:branched-chain amino acid aminotransferase [Aminobacter niigataensis]|uniref:Branched-chain-amino-acid aminotransferase n=1 Tax=Aminobacter niigataensis TaxID=83265 RepID=A0ABR6L9R1_9HYPH|nr:branched-chain amino acid aminotransferase [Aminobacter niigataensis]